MDWDETFDLLSSEYGWSTEYIMSRTTKEIHWRVKRINNRNYGDAKFEAGIHGMKMKGNHDDKPEVDIKPLNKRQEENLDYFMNSRLKQGKV